MQNVAIDPKLIIVEQMAKLSNEITMLNQNLNNVNAIADPSLHDRFVYQLLCAEKEYYGFFNKLRIMCGMTELPGERFVGDFIYQSHLFTA